MFIAFLFLLLLCAGVGVLVWLALRKIAAHARQSPEAAKAIAEHIIAPLLAGGKPDPKPEVGQTRDTLV